MRIVFEGLPASVQQIDRPGETVLRVTGDDGRFVEIRVPFEVEDVPYGTPLQAVMVAQQILNNANEVVAA